MYACQNPGNFHKLSHFFLKLNIKHELENTAVNIKKYNDKFLVF